METKQEVPVLIYTEATPNPASIKFVVNRPIFPGDYVEFESIESTKNAPLAKSLFDTDLITAVFISNNFITITKKEDLLWIEVSPIIKEAIKTHIDQKKAIFDEGFNLSNRKASNEISNEDSDVEVKIKGALEKYVKPAVEMDGGAISFVSFENGILTLALQGSCSGCPSSTVTLKDGIENLMSKMVPEVKEVVAQET